MEKLKTFSPLFLWLISFSISAQIQDSIDFDRLETKRLVKVLEQNNLYTLEDLSSVELACYEGDTDSAKHYYYVFQSFLIDADIETSWWAYMNFNPTSKGAKKDFLHFGMLYSANENKIYYAGDPYPGMSEGELMVWNLRIWGGLAHVSVGQTIHRIDDENKSFEICYLEQGISHGTQTVELKETADGKTEVIHHTYYKSQSKFRDKRLYPGFHDIAISEFHESVKELAESID